MCELRGRDGYMQVQCVFWKKDDPGLLAVLYWHSEVEDLQGSESAEQSVSSQEKQSTKARV